MIIENTTKRGNSYHKMEKLLQWEHVEEVNNHLINGTMPATKLEGWCKERGFNISKQCLYDYKKMLMKAIARDVTIEKLIGEEGNKQEDENIILKKMGITSDTRKLVKTELELLDAIIQKGMESVVQAPVVRIQDALKAVELKNKLTGGAHGGVTMYGLEEVRQLEEAKFESVMGHILQYIPEDKHEELANAIELAEMKFYEQHAPDMAVRFDEIGIDSMPSRMPDMEVVYEGDYEECE